MSTTGRHEFPEKEIKKEIGAKKVRRLLQANLFNFAWPKCIWTVEKLFLVRENYFSINVFLTISWSKIKLFRLKKKKKKKKKNVFK